MTIFTVNELPTWNEFYNIFFKSYIEGNFNDFDKMDEYYKDLPKNFVLLAKACNQLNYMLYDDSTGQYDDIRKVVELHCKTFIQSESVKECNIISFSIGERNDNYISEDKYTIYTFSDDDPFAKMRTHKSLNIHELMNNGKIKINPKLVLSIENIYNDNKSITIDLIDGDNFNNILMIMMNPMSEYYENGIGWKDKDGNIIGQSSPIINPNNQTDPAL